MTPIDLLGYIDPVSGAIVLQLLVAGVLGAVAFFRKSIWRMLRFITRRGNDDERTE